MTITDETSKSNLTKCLSNPILGLIPFLLFIILHAIHMGEPRAILISMAIAAISELFVYHYFKTRKYNTVFFVVIIAFAITLLCSLFDSHFESKNIYVVVCEVVIICLFIALRLSRKYIFMIIFRRKRSTTIDKVYLTTFFESTLFAQYMLSAHLCLVLMYQSIRIPKNLVELSDLIVFAILPVITIISIGIWECMKARAISKRLNQEEWLPIVNEKGEVSGKIAKSISRRMKNKHLHPVVRVALISNGKIFLQEKSKFAITDAGKLDYPFEKYVLLYNDIETSVRNSIKRVAGNSCEGHPKYILNHIFENDVTRRFVFLYVLRIEDEDSLRRTEKLHGKFWTIKQIEDAFEDDIFSESFVLEFEYLKNLIVKEKNCI